MLKKKRIFQSNFNIKTWNSDSEWIICFLFREAKKRHWVDVDEWNTYIAISIGIGMVSR